MASFYCLAANIPSPSALAPAMLHLQRHPTPCHSDCAWQEDNARVLAQNAGRTRETERYSLSSS